MNIIKKFPMDVVPSCPSICIRMWATETTATETETTNNH